METTTLRCTTCGRLVNRLFTARTTVRSLSLHHDVHEGDLICLRCQTELQEELSEEESVKGPA
ncbi:MAG: hypothetical protein NVSMB22_12900 [Chloroflexota bacterium]